MPTGETDNVVMAAPLGGSRSGIAALRVEGMTRPRDEPGVTTCSSAARQRSSPM